MSPNGDDQHHDELQQGGPTNEGATDAAYLSAVSKKLANTA